MSTIISWTNETWNPVTGCHKVSEGCRYCYAETLSLRFGWSKKPWTAANAAENIICHPSRLDKPRKIKTPARIFTNSMSDMWHEQVPDEFLHRVFDVIESTPQHVYQVLTKRPERAAQWKRWPPNVWMGATVEGPGPIAARRLDALRQCKTNGASIVWTSNEPLLGSLADHDFSGIDWLVAGGESGIHLSAALKAYNAGADPRAVNPRWMDMRWARELRDVAVRNSAAYFFKQDSDVKTERRPWLVEEDGTCWVWSQYPGQMMEPYQIDPVTTKAVDVMHRKQSVHAVASMTAA